ncbi:hypothetical protein [Hydrogenophaga sp. BPS33]|uniref:hypothetical protein n=1 Tax=Hydrogenophaga sp. BPS33 TaxID=2651974 RepID=UPI001320055B|nr:hypothetical protein [Hydrogenophaga sp. BPS33]QHE87359.1 hypothetical protein F9K07_21875 [Hydrogenophaga sp. BPS33]
MASTAPTWTTEGEHGLTQDNLRLLLDNRIAVIRIPGFATLAECKSFTEAARTGNIKYYSVAKRIGYIGMAQFEYRWGRQKEDFFAAVPQADRDLVDVVQRCTFDPLQRLIDRLQAVWPNPVHVAREDLGSYYAGIIRFAGEGVDLHVDWAPVNSPHYAIGRIDGQLGWNFFAEELQSGGETTVHNAPWDPEVDEEEIPQSYGLSRELVEGAPKAVYKASAGDVVIFNTRNPHEIAGGTPQPGGSRISIGSFVGRMPDGELVLWS